MSGFQRGGICGLVSHSRLTQHFGMTLGPWDDLHLPLAHGFGLHYDLPVPLYLYLLAGGAVVALTFTILGVFLRGTKGASYPRLVLSSMSSLWILAQPLTGTA